MEYHHRPSLHSPGFQSFPQALGLLLLRLGAGLSLLAWHGWREGFGAWLHLWKKVAWNLPETLATLGFPSPMPVGVALVAAGILGSVFLVLGLLTRVSAAVLAVAAVTAAVLYQAYPERAEKYLLYAVIYIVLLLCGPGWMSADGLLRRAVRRG